MLKEKPHKKTVWRAAGRSLPPVVLGSLLLVASAAFAVTVQEHPPVAATAPRTSAQKLKQSLDKQQKIPVIDVRDAKEFVAGHIPGSVSIPFDELAKKIAEMKISKDTAIVTVCDHGGRSSRAVLELQKLGYRVSSFCPLDSWKKEGYKLDRDPSNP